MFFQIVWEDIGDGKEAFLVDFFLSKLRFEKDASMEIGGRVGGERLMALILDSNIAEDSYF